MNNIESILKKIADDANAAAQQKLDEANAEAQQILKDYQAQADQLRADAQQKAEKEAAVIAERVESQSGLMRRNMMLQYKREAIEQAFQKALEVLCAQPSDEQVQLLSSAASKAIAGDVQIILNQKDGDAFGKQLVDSIQKQLADAGKSYTVSLSSKTASIAGGMILDEGRVETNLSYEILVKNMRDELEAQVARVLTE